MLTEIYSKNEKKCLEINKILDYIKQQPVWIKHYIYAEIRENLKFMLNIDSPYMSDAYVQKYVPQPAAEFQLLQKKRFNPSLLASKNISDNELAFLKTVEFKKNLIEICNENNWSLKECCTILVLLIDKSLIEPMDSGYLSNTIYYLAGKIRLCEYLLRMNKVSLVQVDKALFIQKEISESSGTKTRIGDLLVNMGYINEEDKSDILCLKENSELSCDLVDETDILKRRINELEAKLESANFENDCYKEDLIDFQEELVRQSEIILKLEKNHFKKDKNSFGFYQTFLEKLLNKQLF